MADDSKSSRLESRFGQGFLTDCWWFAALASDVRRGRMVRREMLGEPVMIARTKAGELFALRDVCPHRAAPLSAGRLCEDATVECPYHGWRFGADGACQAIPSLTADQQMDVDRIRVRRFPVVESQGLIFVWIADHVAEPDHAPPVLPGVVGGRPKLVDRMVFDTHIDHAVVGLMDPAHGPYVHRQWWWRTSGSQHDKEKRFEPREAGFAMVRHAPSSNSRAYALLGGKPATEIVFRLPGLRYEHVTVGEKQVLSLTCLTPLDAGRTQITQMMWSDHWAVTLAKPWLEWASRKFIRQDAGMVHLQNEGLKYDPTLLWIDDADRQAKWYQQLKREWIASRREGRAFANPVEPATLRWRS
jgi:phenylpropionate dioxygenase-like ring-hydroxylating dioxygenase large terminal subunit